MRLACSVAALDGLQAGLRVASERDPLRLQVLAVLTEQALRIRARWRLEDALDTGFATATYIAGKTPKLPPRHG